MGLWKAYAEYRRFRALPPDERNIVFYSESGQDWHHFQPLVERLTGELGRRVCYVSSDPGDFGLAPRERLRTFCIGKGLLRIWFFQFLRADVLVLTMMDLGNLELKRSVHPVHYVYVFHGMGSTHMVDNANSYDHYDTILCAAPHQLREIQRREQLAGLPTKRMVEHGYERLEGLMRQAERWRGAPRPAPEPIVLVAPTWGDESLLHVCGEELIAVLLAAGFRVVLRPHHHTLETAPTLVEGIRRRFASHAGFEFVDRMGESDSLFRSDLLVSDWSAISLEYGLALEKPVLFVDVPRRVRNPRYQELGLEPIEVSIRSELGAVLDPKRLDEAPRLVRDLLAAPEAFRARAAALREKCVFHVGRSAELGAAAIARIADERAQERRTRGER